MFFTRECPTEARTYHDPTCPDCGTTVEARALFCRQCLAGLPAWEAYADEHFQGIREYTRKALLREVSNQEFLSSLEPYARNLFESLDVLQMMPQAHTENEVRSTIQALQQFLEGMEVIASYTVTGNSDILICGLEMTEAANHALNGVLVDVSQEEIYPGSLIDLVA